MLTYGRLKSHPSKYSTYWTAPWGGKRVWIGSHPKDLTHAGLITKSHQGDKSCVALFLRAEYQPRTAEAALAFLPFKTSRWYRSRALSFRHGGIFGCLQLPPDFACLLCEHLSFQLRLAHPCRRCCHLFGGQHIPSPCCSWEVVKKSVTRATIWTQLSRISWLLADTRKTAKNRIVQRIKRQRYR